MGPLTEPLRHFIALLEREKIPYVLIGGMAVAALANERFTRDVDLTVVLTTEQAKKLEKIFRNDAAYEIRHIQFVSSPDIPDLFRVIWKEVAVDLIVANTPFQREVVERGRVCNFGDFSVPVATPEDLIIFKLLADRPVDRQDVEMILHAFKDLDWAYIEKWCQAWEIEDRLKKIKNNQK